MTTDFGEIIRRHCRPMRPIPTSTPPMLRKLQGVRAVLFDVYGTLLISDSGDIDARRDGDVEQAFAEALAAVGIRVRADREVSAQTLFDEIAAEHERARSAGVDHPEVDIVEMWRRTVKRIEHSKAPQPIAGSIAHWSAGRSGKGEPDLRRLAMEFELRVNPVWPMPHARHCLERLHEAGLPLGLISNAQFFTGELCQTLLTANTSSFQLEHDLRYYSYQHGRAKPALYLYELAAQCLAQRDIRPPEAVYVGNDMLNDVMPADKVGFRTALFAGDARSLRLREGEPCVAGVTPDIVITDLSQLPLCIA